LLILCQTQNKMKITPSLSVEDLVKMYPQSVHWLRERGIACVICGEPVWGKLGQLLEQSGYSTEEAERLVAEMAAEL
jgi:hypothetical protein